MARQKWSWTNLWQQKTGVKNHWHKILLCFWKHWHFGHDSLVLCRCNSTLDVTTIKANAGCTPDGILWDRQAAMVCTHTSGIQCYRLAPYQRYSLTCAFWKHKENSIINMVRKKNMLSIFPSCQVLQVFPQNHGRSFELCSKPSVVPFYWLVDRDSMGFT